MNNKQIKKLLDKYTNIIERLKEEGVIRTAKIVGDYGEYIMFTK